MHRLTADHEQVTDAEFRAVADAIQAIRRAVVDLNQQVSAIAASRLAEAHSVEEYRAA
jgi:hypothetical protein